MLSRLHAMLLGVQVVDYNVLTTEGTFSRGQLLLSTRVTSTDAALRHIDRDLRSRGQTLQQGGRHTWHTHKRPGLLALAAQLRTETRAVRA